MKICLQIGDHFGLALMYCLSCFTVSCRANCYPRKRISGRIIFNVSCVEYCSSLYGNVHYEWSIYKVLNEDAINGSGTIDLKKQQSHIEQIQDLQGHTNGGTWFAE